MNHKPSTFLRSISIFVFMVMLLITALFACKPSEQFTGKDGNPDDRNPSRPDSSRTLKGKERNMLTWNDILRYAREGNPEPDNVITKSDSVWRAELTPEQYRITRQKGTERPFSSEMCSLFEPGQYACICCKTLLFDSQEKFESGTGWPSFTQPIKANVIAYHEDNTFGMQRIETLCNTCGAHLGHVFPDGPAPGGLRYCINALALKKVDQTKPTHKENEPGK
jgi:methionine-R-sulfoxide reductase